MVRFARSRGSKVGPTAGLAGRGWITSISIPVRPDLLRCDALVRRGQ